MCFADFEQERQCIKEPLLCVNFGLSCVTKIPASSASAESNDNDSNGNTGEKEEAIRRRGKGEESRETH